MLLKVWKVAAFLFILMHASQNVKITSFLINAFEKTDRIYIKTLILPAFVTYIMKAFLTYQGYTLE